MTKIGITRWHGRLALSSFAHKCSCRTLATEGSTVEKHHDNRSSILQSPSLTDIKPDANPHSRSSHVGLNIVDRWVPEHLKKKGPSDYDVLKTKAIATTVKKTTANLGAVFSKRYHPRETIWDPPKPEDITLEMLMAAQTHFGHHTSLWNPKNQRYIYGIRNGIHIISLETTAAHLRRAAKIVESVCYHGGLVLFVGTRKGQDSAVVRASELAKGFHLFERWKPGTITNGDQILKMCRIKAVDPLDQLIEGFEEKLEDWKSLRPDLVVCLNPIENYIMLRECASNNIPTIGVIDTNADPTWVTYIIPANDDSLRASRVIAGVLGSAGKAGQERRLADAKKGKITWKPPPLLGDPVDKDIELIKENTRKVNLMTSSRASSIQASDESYVEPIRDPDWRIKAKAEDEDEIE